MRLGIGWAISHKIGAAHFWRDRRAQRTIALTMTIDIFFLKFSITKKLFIMQKNKIF